MTYSVIKYTSERSERSERLSAAELDGATPSDPREEKKNIYS